MSDYGVSPSEMRRLSNMSDSDLDAMRVGLGPHDDSSMDGIAQFVQDLGEAFPEPSTEDLEDVHVAAMMQVAHLMADNGELVARPASKANGPENQASGLPKPWRETIMTKLRTVFATRAAKVAAGAVALTLAFSGVAVAGVLPAPVQDGVADVVATVGIDLPGGANEIEAPDVEPAEVDGVDQTDATSVDEGDVGNTDDASEAADQTDASSVDQGDENDNDQGDVDNADQGDQDDDQQSSASASSDDNDDEGDDQESTVNKATPPAATSGNSGSSSAGESDGDSENDGASSGSGGSDSGDTGSSDDSDSSDSGGND